MSPADDYASLCTLQKLMRHNGLDLGNGARGQS